MLALDSPQWATLGHAYGPASDIPELLGQLEAVARGTFTSPVREDEFQTEPWFSLWSSLCHQGEVYTASYAALPHIVRITSQFRGLPDENCFLLPVCIEIARRTSRGPKLTEEFAPAYHAALSHFHELARLCAEAPWDEGMTRLVAAALAASKGHIMLAAALIELEPDTVKQILSEHGQDVEDYED